MSLLAFSHTYRRTPEPLRYLLFFAAVSITVVNFFFILSFSINIIETGFRCFHKRSRTAIRTDIFPKVYLQVIAHRRSCSVKRGNADYNNRCKSKGVYTRPLIYWNPIYRNAAQHWKSRLRDSAAIEMPNAGAARRRGCTLSPVLPLIELSAFEEFQRSSFFFLFANLEHVRAAFFC